MAKKTRLPRRQKPRTLKKKLTSKKEADANNSEWKVVDNEFHFRVLEIGHLLKYNFFLLAKTVIFHAVYPDAETFEEALETTENVMAELDLDTKKRLEEEVKAAEIAEADDESDLK